MYNVCSLEASERDGPKSRVKTSSKTRNFINKLKLEPVELNF